METTRCNLCGSDDYRLLYTLQDLHFRIDDRRFDYVQCRRCGLVYQNPRLTSDEIGRYYPSEYECYQVVESGRQTSWLKRRLIDFGFNKRWKTVLRYKPGGTLLDVGCATGNFLFHMHGKPGWVLKGLEVSAEAAGLARSRGLDVTVGTLEESIFAGGEFDAITLWDVLEHLHDPARALNEIHRLLKGDGILVFRVPNLDSWDYRLFKQNWHGFETPRHLYVFTLATLKPLLERAGFRILHAGSEYGSYMTVVLDVRFWMAARGYSRAAIERAARVLYHPALRVIFSPIASLLGGNLKGPSLTIVAAKQPLAAN